MTPQPNTSCPTPKVLSALLDGQIVDPELAEYSEHLEHCEPCQRTVQTLFPSDTLVHSLRGETSRAEKIAESIPDLLIHALKQIPATDSELRISQDGLSRSSGMTLDDLGLSFLSPPQHADEIGRLGNYRVLQVLGRGGMGAVFLAEDPKLSRRVALKVMLPRIASIPAARDRFLREAKAAASLKNDHIVTIHQVDEANGVPFMAMELLHGQSLEDALRAGHQFTIAEVHSIARDIARGLADAHDKGLVHRDIKPGNLWLEQTADGSLRVKILDFGLARAEVEDVHITEYGTIVGTPAFMAPEQARADRPIDARADLFSLGCVMYVLCTGDIPFKADTTVGTLMALALNTPVAPDQRNEAVPPALSDLIMELLEKDPTKRPSSSREVVARLAEIEHAPSSRRPLALGSYATAHAPKPAASALRLKTFFKMAAAIAIAASAWIVAEVFLWKTPDGRVVRIECNDPTIQLAFSGGELKVTGAYDQPVTLAPGKVDLKITKPQPDGTEFVFETDKLVVNKGDEIVLKIEVLDDEVQLLEEVRGLVDSKLLRSTTQQFQDLVAALKRVNPQFDGSVSPTFDDRAITELVMKTDYMTDISPLSDLKGLQTLVLEGNRSASGVTDLAPLQGLPLRDLRLVANLGVSDLSPLNGMQLTRLDLDNTSVSDLSPLTGMPLQRLTLWNWNGTDVTPLQGMPLKHLNIGGNLQLGDLSPLKNCPLEFLCMNYTSVSSIEALEGSPLRTFMCENTPVADLSPLRGTQLEEFVGGGSRITDFSTLREMPLTWVKFDIVPERDLDMLRRITSLVQINDQRAVDFLRELNSDDVSHRVEPAFTNSIGMEFALVPKGKAWLTRKVGENETTTGHETVLKDDFYLGSFEVTQEQWLRVMGSNPSWFTRNADGAESVKVLADDVLNRLPVERVSWVDCQQFLAKLNELDATPGWTYRLPTEAEWQYACRGGPMADASQSVLEFCTTTRTGSLTVDDANIQHQLGWNRPCRVGLFPPNPLGLHDMHGNVWEWCHDAAPWRTEPSRFVHGGAWSDSSNSCRASDIKQPTEPWLYYDLGLRVARVRTP